MIVANILQKNEDSTQPLLEQLTDILVDRRLSYRKVAQKLIELNKQEQCVAFFEDKLRQEENSSAIDLLLEFALLLKDSLNQPETAKQYYQKVIDKVPDNREALNALQVPKQHQP